MTKSLKLHNDIILYSSHHAKPILADARYIFNKKKKPVILFIHGFKGFKDWGHFNLIADEVAKRDFIFVKFNLSHNGTTVENPTDFVDLEAFSNNNSVKVDNAKFIHELNPDSKLLLIEGANHVFGGGHPFADEELPKNTHQALDKTLRFFNHYS